MYGTNPRASLDLVLVPYLKRECKVFEELITQLQEIHKATIQNLQESAAKYKASANNLNFLPAFEGVNETKR